MVINTLKFFVFILFVTSISGDNDTYTTRILISNTEAERIPQTAQCVLQLSAKYFVEKRALSGSIVIININSYKSTTERILLQTLHNGIKYSIMAKDSLYPHYNASHFPEKAKNYMMIMEEKVELIRNILQLNKLPTWNPHAKTIIFYELKDDENDIDTVKEFIDELRNYKMFKIIVLLYKSELKQVVSYSWKPYTHNNCGGKSKEIYILDKCTDGDIQLVNKEEEKFPLDMLGCPLVVYAVISEPYVMPPLVRLYNTTYEDAYFFDLGVEVNLMKIIAQFTNMTLIIRMTNISENWGSIYLDGSATGVYELLRNESSDVIIGNMEVNRVIRKWFDPTFTYMQDEITWCVPRATLASTWSNLVAIFQWTTWVATFLSVIVMGLMFHILYYRENRSKSSLWPTNSILMTYSMLLGWGSLFRPKSVPFRILVGTWLLFSINMTISYGSFLRGFLIHPRYDKQVKNDMEIVESKLNFGGRANYRSFFESNNFSNYFFYNNYAERLFLESITDTALNRNFSTVSSRRQAEYQDQKLGMGYKLIYCFQEEESLYKYGVVLLTRKWFPLVERFNTIIRSVSENGLIWKWNSEVYLHATIDTESNIVVPLNIQHLLGAFLFIAIMYAACIFIFIVEVLMFNFRFKTRK